jgi:hypothetical protein
MGSSRKVTRPAQAIKDEANKAIKMTMIHYFERSNKVASVYTYTRQELMHRGICSWK